MRIMLTAAAIAFALAAPVAAQSAPPPGKAIVSIYHVAPGQQGAFLRWLDQQDRVNVAAGVARSQFYAHTDGDSWDYLVISPATTDAQDAAVEAAGKKMGIDMMRGGLEMRKHISSHTDTFVRGPMNVADYMAMVGEK